MSEAEPHVHEHHPDHAEAAPAEVPAHDGPPTEEEVRAALQTVEDPELRMSIVDLGLLYGVTIEDDGLVSVDLTLTSPACPVGFTSSSMFRASAAASMPSWSRRMSFVLSNSK